MAYKIVLVEKASLELMQASSFYEKISPTLATDLLDKFYHAASKLRENPVLYQEIKRGFHKINLERFPYKIVYQIKGDEIRVVAFAHHKRKPGYWKNR